MKAALLEKIDAPLVIRELLPTMLMPGQVLVKVKASGICGAQLHEIRGHKGNEKFLPHPMGHEGCGIVKEVGPGVTTVKEGDKVVMHWRPGAGIESDFPKYVINNTDKLITGGKCTTLSEESIVSENRVTKVPSDTPTVLAAMLGCSLTTALGIIDNECDLKFGESVAVIGCGGVGLNLLQAAKMRSAFPIYGVDINDNMMDLSMQMGADVYASSLDNIPHKVDVILDTTGIPAVISQAFDKLAPSGRLILVGQPQPGTSLNILNPLSFFDGQGKSVRASQGGGTKPEVDIPRYVALANRGIIDYETLHTDTFKLDEINEAFDLLKSGNAGRIIIKMEEEV